MSHHVIRVYALEERYHHVDPGFHTRLAPGAARLVDEVPGEDGGIILVNAPVHCRHTQQALVTEIGL